MASESGVPEHRFGTSDSFSREMVREMASGPPSGKSATETRAMSRRSEMISEEESSAVPPTPTEASAVSGSGSAELSGSAAEDDKKTTAASGEQEEERAPARFALEDFTRCSKSHLWKLMMSFYDRKGVKSWSQGIVPHFITSNAFIGRAYAKVLVGFIRDCMSPNATMKLDPSEPLYIVELGAGSGKFSFFMLKALNDLAGLLPNFSPSKIIYVMTDFTQNNLNFWNQHPGLRPYIEKGQLDLAIFDAVNDETMKLHHSGVTLEPNALKNPICVVANYLFDTLCHDVFQVDNNELKEGLISVGSRFSFEEDPLDPEIIKRFDNRFRYEPVDADKYYADENEADAEHFKRILRWYLDYFGASPTGASILMPIGALRALRRLTSFTNGRALVLSGDKGNNNPEQFRGLIDPHIAVHGSFSVMVNYHAIGLYFVSRNGFVLHNPQEEASLKVSAFVLTGEDDEQQQQQSSSAATKTAATPDKKTTTMKNEPRSADDAESVATKVGDDEDQEGGEEEDTVGAAASVSDKDGSSKGEGYAKTTTTRRQSLWTGDEMEEISAERSRLFPQLCRVFEDEIVRFGPNDFFVLQKSMKEDSQQPTLKGIIALLKLGDWDPDVFYKFRDVILNQTPLCGNKLRNDLCRDLPRVWDNHYSLDEDKDVSFEVGRFYYGIREHEKALQFYRTSTEHIGEHHVTFHNMGLCYYSLGMLDVALENFGKSLKLNTKYDKARSWHLKVSKEIERKKQFLQQDDEPAANVPPGDQGDRPSLDAPQWSSSSAST